VSSRIQAKIKSREALKIILAALPKDKLTVFTNGCFDILHAGHVEYLERAKKLGDILIVALNEDKSVRKLKGPARPVNSLEDRARVIAALESVDYVTWFGENVPLNIIVSLKPKLLVKGGDYKVSEMIGAKEIKTWGGKAKALPFILGKSTTSILKRAARK